MTFFRTFLVSVADAGRDLLDRYKLSEGGNADITSLVRDLVTQKGEALGSALAMEVVSSYRKLDEAGRRKFFYDMLNEFDVDRTKLDAAITAYQTDPGPETAQGVSKAAEPIRQKVIRGINMAPRGTEAVVAMRNDLLSMLKAEPDLKPVDVDFAHLLGSWFNRGFLELRRIDWNTPANILEKLIAYEAVHEIRDWDDLRRRLDQDRRCYAFFHPALHDEPLIFVEVALVNGISSSVQVLLDDSAERLLPQKADTAIFYSISNCQTGLKGISFGNFLIKQVVSELRAELPNLETFSTLSPVPGFGRWLKSKPDTEPSHLAALEEPGWISDKSKVSALKEPLQSLCARFLVQEKIRSRPLDPVARFHLGNGAKLERINWMGDTSEKGIRESAGILVNYKYDLDSIEENHEKFANEGIVAISRQVEHLLKGE